MPTFHEILTGQCDGKLWTCVRVHRLSVFTPDEVKREEEIARTGARRSRRFTIRIASGIRLTKRLETLRAEAE